LGRLDSSMDVCSAHQVFAGLRSASHKPTAITTIVPPINHEVGMEAEGRAGAGAGVGLIVAALVGVACGSAVVVASNADDACAIAVAGRVTGGGGAVCVGNGVAAGSGVAAA